FREAGLARGMRVLDVGCGSGDVSFLAAEFVGPDGHVVGVDRAPESLARAERRNQDRGLRNVSWIRGDPTELEFDAPFDAIIGRLVLMYYRDPASALRKLHHKLRPGGLIVFQELDPGACRSFPVSPTSSKCVDLICRTLEISGARPQLGLELYPLFVSAGFPDTRLRMGGYICGGLDNPLCEHIADVVGSLMPAMEKFGIASAEELDVDGLADRLRREVSENGGVITSPSLVGAWSRKQSGS